MSKIDDALDIIQGMTILELRDLNSAIEEEFGVTAAAPMAMAAAANTGFKSIPKYGYSIPAAIGIPRLL